MSMYRLPSSRLTIVHGIMEISRLSKNGYIDDNDIMVYRLEGRIIYAPDYNYMIGYMSVWESDHCFEIVDMYKLPLNIRLDILENI